MSDSKELATQASGGSLQQVGDTRFSQTIQMVREAMLNPDVDATKAKVMADLMTSLEDRSMASEFNRDLNAAMMEMPIITKAGIIKIPANVAKGTPERTQGRYARFEDIDRVVRPVLQRHNLAIRFEVGESDKVTTVTPILSHANGHTERGQPMRVPLDDSGAKNNVQGVGSAVSYGKRYTMCASLNIITEGTDDDGSLGKHIVNMTHEREVTVLEQAEEAGRQGRYQEWYMGQGVKDRAWLVSSGHHARLGGSLPLTGPDTRPRAPPPPPPPPSTAKQAAPANGGDTPEGWTARYEAELSGAKDLEAVGRIVARGANALKRLEDGGHGKLYDRALYAADEARDRLRDAGLFGGRE